MKSATAKSTATRKPVKKLGKKQKVHISFNQEKRVDYINGFHKRKQQRRKFGHDFEAYKIRRKQLEARKQIRMEKKVLLAEAEKAAKLSMDDENEVNEDDNDLNEDEDDNATSTTVLKTVLHNSNECTRGDEVSVTTTIGIPDSEEEDFYESDKELLDRIKQNRKPQENMTLFQRIQKKRKGITLPKKKKTKDGKVKAVLKQSIIKLGKYQNKDEEKKKPNETRKQRKDNKKQSKNKTKRR